MEKPIFTNQFMKVNINVERSMVLEKKYGRMVTNTMEYGRIIK